VLATLLERNLVTIRGRSKVVGRPLLYGSTPEFLDYFGLRDLSELPRPEELRALVAAREPEQLDMMEIEVLAQVGSDLPVSSDQPHEIEPLEDVEGEGEPAFEADAHDDGGHEDGEPAGPAPIDAGAPAGMEDAARERT
jgi:hypothetical protein